MMGEIGMANLTLTGYEYDAARQGEERLGQPAERRVAASLPKGVTLQLGRVMDDGSTSCGYKKLC